MLILFLQSREPQVLPCLELMAGNTLFDMNFDIRLLTEMPDIDHLRTAINRSDNYLLVFLSIIRILLTFMALLCQYVRQN